MRLPNWLTGILDRALDGIPPAKEECVRLLGPPATSLEARALMAVADAASRERFGNQAILLGQIGVETAPCPGNCGFCVFGEEHTTFERVRLPQEEVVGRARSFAASGDLYAVFLMTMHEFPTEELLSTIEAVQSAVPGHTQIVVNLGDFDAAQARRLKDAGVHGAYHVCRLREGIDTSLDPEARKRTFRIIRDAGLDFYYCCEPIGPEHTPEELVEQMFLGIECGCFQHAAMRRVAVPGLPLAGRGQISELRLAQVVAAVTLASLGCAETQSIAVHEPNLLGLTSGANVVYAETGANPRDAATDTAQGRGLDMAAARKMLYEAAFASVRRGDGGSVPLVCPALEESVRKGEQAAC